MQPFFTAERQWLRYIGSAVFVQNERRSHGRRSPFICDFGNRVKFGKGVFLNHSAILSASGGIEFEDGVMSAPGLRIASINHDMNERHTKYTYGKVLIKKNAWIRLNRRSESGDSQKVQADLHQSQNVLRRKT